MICKNCGALIRHNEEYCKKCGNLLINFQQRENKSLKNVCVENNIRGKLRGLSSKITHEDKNLHDAEKASEKINSNSGAILDIGDTINKYINKYNESEPKEVEDKETVSNNKSSEEDNENGDTFSLENLTGKSIGEIITAIAVIVTIIISLF